MEASSAPDLGALRKARATNAKLMKGNLVLLMSIRETQSDIERDWYQLQRYHQEMQALGIPIPPECNAILDDAPPNEEGPAAADSGDVTMTSDTPDERPKASDDVEEKLKSSSASGRTNDSDGRDDSESSSDSSSDD